MMKLTEKMKEVLSNADLEKNEINDVPMKTANGLEDRKLISSDWQKKFGQITSRGTFPIYHQVKLTELGLETAMLLIKKQQGK